jgi:hypothetical protein
MTLVAAGAAFLVLFRADGLLAAEGTALSARKKKKVCEKNAAQS